MGAFTSKLAEVFKPVQTGGAPEKPAQTKVAQAKETPVEAKKPITVNEVARMYNRPSSFIDRLPWYEFDSKTKTLLLDDGISVAAIYDIVPIASEGRSYNWLQDQRDLV